MHPSMFITWNQIELWPCRFRHNKFLFVAFLNHESSHILEGQWLFISSCFSFWIYVDRQCKMLWNRPFVKKALIPFELPTDFDTAPSLSVKQLLPHLQARRIRLISLPSFSFQIYLSYALQLLRLPAGGVLRGFFVVWASFFSPLPGRSRSRSRCWAAIRLSHHPEPSGVVTCSLSGG